MIRASDLEVIHLVVSAGTEIPIHKALGDITVQCLEGRVLLTAQGKSQELEAGQFVYLAAAEPHSLKGIEDASLLVTIQLPKHDQRIDLVREACGESMVANPSPIDSQFGDAG